MSTFMQFFSGDKAKVDPANVNITITGGILGLLYHKTGPNEMTVSAGACKDRTGLLDIQIPNDVQVAIPNTPNTVFNLFACTDNTIKVDTDVHGANLIATGISVRWIGFATTMGTGELYQQQITIDERHIFVVSGAGAVGRMKNGTFDLKLYVPAEKVRAFSIKAVWNCIFRISENGGAFGGKTTSGWVSGGRADVPLPAGITTFDLSGTSSGHSQCLQSVIVIR